MTEVKETGDLCVPIAGRGEESTTMGADAGETTVMSLSSTALVGTSRRKGVEKWHLGRAQLPVLTLAGYERKLLLFLGDAALLNGALLLSLALAPRVLQSLGLAPRPYLTMGLVTVFANLRWFIVLTLLWWLVAAVLNTYDVQAAAGMLTGPLAALRNLSVVAVVYFFIPVLSAPLTRSRLSWALFFMLAATGLVAWRLIYATVLVQPHFRKRVLIVGAGRLGETILSTIREGQEANYEVVGFVDDDPEKAGTTVGDVPVLGRRYDLLELIQEQDVGQVIVAVAHEREIHADLFQALMDCHELGVDVTPMVPFYEELTGRVPVQHVGQQLSALLPLNHNPLASLYRLVRRIVDLAVALVGLAGLAVMLPLVALLIRLDSPGPIFFRQTRIGKGGRQFQLLKFRTMVEDAERPGEAVWAKQEDDRVTAFGRFARKVRLDEVPQLWNVLRGEMSLIGPRPERPEFVEQLEAEIPFYRSRHAVKPGITGWAQINYGYGSTVDEALTKLQYDLYYIKHQSFYLDLLILFRTAGTVLSFRGR